MTINQRTEYRLMELKEEFIYRKEKRTGKKTFYYMQCVPDGSKHEYAQNQKAITSGRKKQSKQQSIS